MRRHLALTILLSAVVLGACGTRGSLYLPPPRKPAPAPATADMQPMPPANDLNTAKGPAQ